MQGTFCKHTSIRYVIDAHYLEKNLEGGSSVVNK